MQELVEQLNITWGVDGWTVNFKEEWVTIAMSHWGSRADALDVFFDYVEHLHEFFEKENDLSDQMHREKMFVRRYAGQLKQVRKQSCR